MGSLNKVQLIGHLGRKPELKATASGKSVARFTMATNGRKDEGPTWHRIAVWDSLAETCTAHLDKGSQVYVEGRLDYQEFEKDGTKRSVTEIIASSVQFLDKKSGEGESAPSTDDSTPF